MRRIPFLIAAAFAASLLFSSCKNKTTGLAIPKDAVMVLHVNTSSLTSKLSWNEIKASNWFKEMSEDEHDSLTKKLLENPENSGIDLKSDFALFMRREGTGGYMACEGSLKDANAFEAMVKNVSHGAETQKNGDLKFIKTGEHDIVSWTSSKFVTMSDAPFFHEVSPFGRRSYPSNNEKFSTDSLKKFTSDLFSLSSSDNLEKDKRFSSLLNEKGDVHFWMNYDQYVSSVGAGFLSMLKIGSLMEGNAITYTLNFDDGKISVKSKTFFGKEMANLMEKFKPRTITKELIDRIPSQNVVGAIAFSFDPAGLKEFFRASGLDGFINGFAGEIGMNMDELVNATGGDFLFAAGDFSLQKKTITIPPYSSESKPYTYNKTEPDGKFLFATSVHDRSSFEKILGIVKEKIGMGEDSSQLSMKMNNNWFVLSNKAETANQFLSGGNNNVPFASKITGHPFGMYVDFQKLIKGLSSEVDNAADSAAYDASLKMWQDAIGTGGEYHNGESSMVFEINLVDKTKNSLKQINEYADKMNAARKLRHHGYNVAGTDSTVVRPIEITPNTK
jgi:Domain of unknown function (DUF4836)